MKKIRYLIEAGILWAAFFIFGLMSADCASACGRWIGRTVGPRLGASRKAMDNLQKAMPENSDELNQSIIVDMWDNLGRVIAEYPHLNEIVTKRTEFVGQEFVKDLIGGKPGLLIGAHQANWEIGPFYFYSFKEWLIACIYRAPNNPHVDKLLERCRNAGSEKFYIPKSQRGARDIVMTLKNNGSIALLIDQKYNQGIPVEFFGRPAMTSTSFAQLAKKFDCPIVPYRIERLEGCRFRLTLYSPIKVEGRTEEDIVLEANRMLEGWIRERPGQWLWLHRRWNSKALRELDNVK